MYKTNNFWLQNQSWDVLAGASAILKDASAKGTMSCAQNTAIVIR